MFPQEDFAPPCSGPVSPISIPPPTTTLLRLCGPSGSRGAHGHAQQPRAQPQPGTMEHPEPELRKPCSSRGVGMGAFPRLPHSDTSGVSWGEGPYLVDGPCPPSCGFSKARQRSTPVSPPQIQAGGTVPSHRDLPLSWSQQPKREEGGERHLGEPGGSLGTHSVPDPLVWSF